MNTLVLFHRNCIDGFASAWIWWKKHGDIDHVYRGYYSGDYLNTDEFDRFVFLDCSPKAREIRKILQAKKKIVLIDHHKSTADTLERLYSHERTQFEANIYDENRSAVFMVAEHLQVVDPNLNKLFLYIEDRDFSRYHLDYTREINIAMSNLPKIFFEWDKILKNWDTAFKDFLTVGQALVRYQDNIVSIVCKYDHVVHYGHSETLSIPLINSNLYQSEIGHLLCRLLNVKVAGCFSIKGNMVNINIQGEAVNRIAEDYNGGGSYKYAGFMIPLSLFYERIKK